MFQITDEAVCKAGVKAALTAGYRLIDTAACYGNERAVGAAIRESDILREEIFISSKVWIQDADYEKTKASFAKTLENLDTDYLDLYLIHMPYGDYHGAWRAMGTASRSNSKGGRLDDERKIREMTKNSKPLADPFARGLLFSSLMFILLHFSRTLPPMI